jgi:hypothetical protein
MPKPPITDSPWLWFSLFLIVGLTALLMTGGKFGKRQANIERQGQARTALAEGMETTVDGLGKKQTTRRPPVYSTPEQTQIRLVPMAVTLGLLLTVSLGLLAREQFRIHHGDTKDTEVNQEV